MAQIAQEYEYAYTNSNLANVNFMQDRIHNLLNIAKLENSIDIAIAFEVIEYLIYPKDLVRSAKKCLNSNGKLILTAPYHG